MINRTDRTTDGQFRIFFANNNKQNDRNATLNVKLLILMFFLIYLI